MAESVSSSGRQSPIIQFKLCSTNENALPSLSNTLRVRQTNRYFCIVSLQQYFYFQSSSEIHSNKINHEKRIKTIREIISSIDILIITSFETIVYLFEN